MKCFSDISLILYSEPQNVGHPHLWRKINSYLCVLHNVLKSHTHTRDCLGDNFRISQKTLPEVVLFLGRWFCNRAPYKICGRIKVGEIRSPWIRKRVTLQENLNGSFFLTSILMWWTSECITWAEQGQKCGQTWHKRKPLTLQKAWASLPLWERLARDRQQSSHNFLNSGAASEKSFIRSWGCPRQ